MRRYTLANAVDDALGPLRDLDAIAKRLDLDQRETFARVVASRVFGTELPDRGRGREAVRALLDEIAQDIRIECHSPRCPAYQDNPCQCWVADIGLLLEPKSGQGVTSA